MFSGFHGDTFNCPAEVAEARYGLYVDRLALNDAPGGEGEHRGGKGIVVEYRVRSNGCFFTCAYTRNIHKPWPQEGGLEGSPNYAEVIRRDGSVEQFAVVTGLAVERGRRDPDPHRQRRRLRRPEPPGTRARARRPAERLRHRRAGDRGLRSRAAGVVSSTADPFTLEIIQGSLQAASDEMFAVLRKTAMSAIIYEVLDAGTAITDGDGNLASSGAGIPSFVGVLDKAVKRILELHGAEGAIRPGDVFVTNDPFYGGVTHLNDVVIAMPVFAGGSCARGRRASPTGTTSAGWCPARSRREATEIFQEGLRLPAVKLIDAGEELTAVTRIMRANSRLPEFLLGDMWAGIAAARLGARRIVELVERFGLDTFAEALERLHDSRRAGGAADARRRSRTARSRSPRSRTAAPSTTSRCGSRPTELVVDLRDNPDQDAGPSNVSRDGATIAAQMVLMNLAECGRRGQRRALPAADRAHPPRLGVRPGAPGGVRRLLRGADPPLRPDPALPRASPRRAACRRAGSPRSAARSSAAGIPTRAGTSRSSSPRWAAGARPPSATG